MNNDPEWLLATSPEYQEYYAAITTPEYLDARDRIEDENDELIRSMDHEPFLDLSPKDVLLTLDGELYEGHK